MNSNCRMCNGRVIIPDGSADSLEYCVACQSKPMFDDDITKLPNVPVPSLDSDDIAKHLEKGSKKRGNVDLLSVLKRMDAMGVEDILDRSTMHFLDVHVDEIADLVTVQDLDIMAAANIKVDQHGYLYADITTKPRAGRYATAHARNH